MPQFTNPIAFDRRCIRSGCVALLAPYLPSTPQSCALPEAAHRRSLCNAVFMNWGAT